MYIKALNRRPPFVYINLFPMRAFTIAYTMHKHIHRYTSGGQAELPAVGIYQRLSCQFLAGCQSSETPSFFYTISPNHHRRPKYVTYVHHIFCTRKMDFNRIRESFGVFGTEGNVLRTIKYVLRGYPAKGKNVWHSWFQNFPFFFNLKKI